MNKLLTRLLLWFAAGMGLDLQGRILDHFLDQWVEAWPVLSFLQ